MSDPVYKEMIDVMNARSMMYGGMDIPEFDIIHVAAFMSG
jgi:hypothetical protein